MCVDDAAVRYTKFAQARLPLLQRGTAGATEADMVQADAKLAEIRVGHRLIVLMDTEYRAAVQEPRLMPEPGVGVLVEQWVGAEQFPIPGAADLDVAHRHRDG